MDNFFFGDILGDMERWNGSQMLDPIKYQKGVASVAFNGYDQLPTTQQPTTVNMVFYPTFIATNIALAGSDISINETEMQTLNLVKTVMKARTQDSADDIGNMFQGDSTAFGGKAPNGLANIVDNGAVASTFGGLSRATYSGLNATVTASGGTISLLKVRQLANSITDGRVSPDLCLTDYTTWAYFEQLLQAFQRNTFSDFVKMDAGTGFRANGLIWDGLVIYKDKKVVTGNFYLLNKDFLKFRGLNWYRGKPVTLEDKNIQGNIYEYNPSNATKGFTWTGFIEAYNQGAVNGFIILGGQLVCTAPFRNGVLTGITGV